MEIKKLLRHLKVMIGILIVKIVELEKNVKKGYCCLMDKAINVSLNRLYDMIKMEDDLK